MIDQTELRNKLWELRNKSILAWIPEESQAKIIQDFQFRTFQRGQFFHEEINPTDLAIMITGKAALLTKDTNTLKEKIIPGRSFELSSYMHSLKKEFKWLAQEDTCIGIISFQTLLKYLNQNDSYDYLKKISTKVELQRIKNDLRMLGVKQQDLKTIICNLEEKKEVQDVGQLHIISKGSITLLHPTTDQSVRTLMISDYFISGITNFKMIKTEDLSFWVLSKSVNLDEKLGPSILLFLDKIKAEENNLTSVAQEYDDSDLYEEPDEDQELNIDFFYKNNNQDKFPTKSKPVAIRQHDSMDCGAACMAMISQFYRRNIKISTWRRLIFITREGASMLAIKQAAEKVGFHTIGIMSNAKSLKDFVTPFISLMEYHYVVVYKINEEKVTIADPARGLVVISFEDFKKDYSTNCLLLKPKSELYHYPESPPSYKRYLNIFKPHYFDFLQLVLFSSILFFFNLAPPLFTQYIFDSILPTGKIESMRTIAILSISFSVLVMILSLVRLSFMIKIASTISLKLTSLFFRQILRLPLGYFTVRNVGDITTRIDELENIRSFFTNGSLSIFQSLLAIIIYTGILTIYHPYFTLLTLLCILVCIVVVTPISKKIKQLTQDLFHGMGGASSIMFEQLNGLRTIQSIAGNLQARWRWEEKQNKVLERRQKIEKSISKAMSVGAGVSQIMSLSYLTLAIFLFLEKEITIGQVVASISISAMIIMPVISLIQSIDDLGQLNVSFEKVDEIITSKIEADNNTSPFPVNFQQIEFKEVWFKYGGDFSPWILKNLNLTVKKGEKIAFVGPSGSGKSTASYMLNLIYQNQKGDILFDDVKNTEIGLQELRSNISMIVQDNSILIGTVLSNIALGDTSPNLTRATQAAKLAEAHDFIMGLPEGYQTNVGGEHGVSMSGGQRQRISIARAIYRSPSVLILDEATSALDTITEKKVMNNLYTSLKNVTCFIIAHRLNTIVDADRIVVIKDGKIKEVGSHEELMKKQGVYYNMFRKQIAT
jgi:subfamily B ATP-binding cassette protein HlyB/CyaB